MATNDGFPPDDHVPFFLSEHAEQTGQPDIGNALGRATFSSRILKASILGVTATAAIGIAIVSMGDPVALVANVTATWVDKSTLQPDNTPQPAPAIQSIADTQDLPTTTSDAPAREEVAAAVEPADQSQPETGQPLTEALFKQFQAWADEQDTRAQVEPATARASCSCTGGARCPNAGPAGEEAPTGPVRAKCTRRGPAPAKSSSEDPGRKCTDTDRASTGRPSTGAASAK